MGHGPSFRIWTASLIHLVDRSDSLSITDAADQLITWFSWTAWSVSADLLDSADELERWLLVKARFVFDSTSDLYSCNLTPSFLPVSQCRSSQSWHTEPYTHILLSVLCPHDLWVYQDILESNPWFHSTGYIVFFWMMLNDFHRATPTVYLR